MDNASNTKFKEVTRVCVYPKDVQILTGKSERWSREILRKMKASLNKSEHQFITVEELSLYFGLKEEKVSQTLHL